MELPAKISDYDIPDEWKINTNVKTLQKAVERKSVPRKSLFASIPLICRGDRCPYALACYEWLKVEVEVGQRCPSEMGNIINYEKFYIKSLNVKLDNFVDISLIRDLINCDVIIDRAYKLLSLEDMVIDVTVHMDEHGNESTAPAEHVAHIILEKQLNRKHKIMTLLNATPKDRFKSGTTTTKDISNIMIELKKALKD